MVNFKNPDTLEWVLKRQWGFDIAPILFKKWTHLFYANRERVDEILIWVRFPALPPHFWTIEVFRKSETTWGLFWRQICLFWKPDLGTLLEFWLNWAQEKD